MKSHLHTLLIHCRDVHTFVETQVSISGNFVSQTLVVRFQTRRVPICQWNILPSEELHPPLVGVTLRFHLHPTARYPLNLLFGHLRPRFLEGRLSVFIAGPLLALEDEAPLVAVMSCFIVISSSPIRQNFSGGQSHSSDTASLWLDEEGLLLFPCIHTCLFSG